MASRVQQILEECALKLAEELQETTYYFVVKSDDAFTTVYSAQDNDGARALSFACRKAADKFESF